MTSKQRAYLKSLAMDQSAILQIGKSSLTPEITRSVDEALEARELIKIHVLKNCFDDGSSIAEVLAERTRAEVVQVIGKRRRSPAGGSPTVLAVGAGRPKTRSSDRNARRDCGCCRARGGQNTDPSNIREDPFYG